jgi:uncharacterized protein YjbI with pentapeptide repeats
MVSKALMLAILGLWISLGNVAKADECLMPFAPSRFKPGHCGRPPCDKDKEGKCILHSRVRNKDSKLFWREIRKMLANHDYDFSYFVFPDDADFADYTFDQPAYFDGAEFRGLARFWGARFEQPAFFGHAQFFGQADFSGGRFGSLAHFWNATFNDGASFGARDFGGEAAFEEAKFIKKGLTTFGEAHFKQKVSFDSAHFTVPASFARAQFDREVIFSGGPGTQVFGRSADTDFRWVTFVRPELVRFKRVYLGRALVAETDLKDVRFIGARWAKRRFGPWFSGWAVWDELRPAYAKAVEIEVNKDYAVIEETYRGLKKNYSEAGDPVGAGYFHFRYLEARRHQASASGLLHAYLILSAYGESPLLPVVWMAILWAVFVAFFWIARVRSSQSNEDAPRLRGALLFSLMVLVSHPTNGFRPASLVGHVLCIFERLFGLLLLALLVLAINRAVGF